MRGETEAFAELVAAHQNAVYAVAFCNTGDPVLSEDIAQETFLQAWRSLHSLREAKRVRAWLCGVARNLSRNAQRKRARETISAELDAIDDSPDPRDAAMTIEAQRMVWDALKKLSVTHREALLLYYQMGKSAKEVAGTLDVSEEVVLQRLHRGRRELKKQVFRRIEGGLAKMRPTAALSLAVMAAVTATGTDAAALSRASIEAKGATGMTTTTKVIATVSAAAIASIIVWATVANGGSNNARNLKRVDTTGVTEAKRESKTSPFTSKSRPVLKKRRVAADSSGAAADRRRPRLADGKQRLSRKQSPPVDPALFKSLGLHEGPSRGTPNAPILMVVFTDFHCKYCGKVLGTIDQLLAEYKGKVRVVSKMFPVKPGSIALAKAVTAADKQGKFWEMTNLLYANQDKPMPDKKQLAAYAKQLGLDVHKFEQAYDSDAVKDEVNAQIQAGKAIGVRGTPTVFVNGKRIMGAQPIANFRKLIDETLKP